MVQQKVLDQIDSDEIDAHIVWMPVLRNDDFEAAKRAPTLIPDERAKHYWDGDQDLGKLYGRIVDLPKGRELAWDIYFVFAPGVVWGDQAPAPTDWTHQLGRDERHLGEGDRLRAAVERLTKEPGG